MRILGIETTCDETASSVVEDGAKILSNVVFSQVSIHRKFHGVVPELASRAHMEKISAVIKEALQTAEDGKMGRWENGRGKKKFIDAVAFARGPGLPGALLVGRVAAETMSRILKVPIVGVNHLE
ncbi:MAG TPA: tRNA (adenosine(37)-N6)-threonylcarbamoyltransferase complex transferase subunit TsaD, partial [bacterium]|nr:tRNA (adenosine(37)-N6)-threonylcarbamoyltransferase complex transferase subunit TsaD [bacterium]